jgi:adhesin transport system outer membrane protein
VLSKNSIRRFCLTASAVALMSGISGMALAQQDPVLHPALSISLRDAVATGVETNPEYGEVAASRRATDEELNQGKAKYLPSIDMRADTGPEYTDSELTDDSETLWRYLASVTLTQMLFDGFETKYEVARQKARVNSSANRVRETAELVGLSVVEAYLEVLRQRQILMIARQNVDAHLSIMDQIKEGVNAGRSTQADFEQSNARLAAARATESQIRQSLRTAEAQYRAETGDAPGQLTLPEIPYGNLTQDVDQEVEKALAYSPTLDIFEADIEVAYAEAQGTRSTFYPQLDLEVNANQGHNIDGIEGTNRGASALLVMNWNLYRGGADMARSREFIHRHQQSKESRARAGRAVENDVRSTWASMVSAGERAREFAAQAAANTEVVKAYQDQFNLDRRTLLDVLDAQNELFVSRTSTINAEFLEMFAVFRLLALKGTLLPTLGVEYPRESAIASGETWSTEEKMKAR